ncbi:MAG TPA: hypothetical protein PKA63_02025 [Oligoflexia bacterium]|nr:hypothetical protein [Oligoflexia bacterium]HMP47428.1 hypothetical protein [Oligoflexia bacterium]
MQRFDPLVFLILLILYQYLILPNALQDPGIGWHLRIGELTYLSRNIPSIDPFLFAPENSIWIHDQWLGSVILWLIYDFAGAQFLKFFTCFIILLSFYLHRPWLSATSGSPILSSLWIIIAVLVSSPFWSARPVLFSFLCFSILLFVTRFYESRFNSWQLRSSIFFLFALWASLHGGWTLGLIWFSLFIIIKTISGFYKSDCDSLQSSKWQIKFGEMILAINTILIPFAATLINPYGANLHRSIFQLVSSPYFMSLNDEWLAPTLSLTFLPLFSLLFLFVIFGIYSQKKQQLHLPFFILSVIFLALSFKSARIAPFFALTTLLTGASLLYPISRLFKILTGTFFSIKNEFAILMFAFFFGLYSIQGKESNFEGSRAPQLLVQALKGEGSCKGPILNHPDWGGDIIYYLWPGIKPYIDDRNQVSREEKYKKYFEIQNDFQVFNKFVEENKVKAVLVQDKSILNQALEEDSSWRLVERQKSLQYGSISLYCLSQ